MNYSPKRLPMRPDRIAQPIAGVAFANVSPPAKDDLSDWVELMEAIEALCPVWPQREGRQLTETYRL